jgi:foldase protein PrsA
MTLLLVLLLGLTACGGEPAQTPAPQVTSDSQAAEQTTTGSGDAAALVNGAPISRQAFDRALERAQRYSTTGEQAGLANAVLDTLLEQQIIMQAAAELGISVSDAEVQAEIDKLVGSAGSGQNWQDWLAANLFTEAEIFQAAREQLMTLRLRDAVLAQEAGQGTARTVTQVRARHILVATEAEANQVLERIAAGEDFGALAQQLSRDVTTADSGGDLGFFVREDLTTPELADAAFSMNVNEITGPVATALGYHVVQTLEFATVEIPAEGPAVENEARFADWLRERRAGAVIERFVP